jgi:hypothetical protein
MTTRSPKSILESTSGSFLASGGSDDDHYLFRTDLKGSADRAFRAVGSRPPALAEKLPAQ